MTEMKSIVESWREYVNEQEEGPDQEQVSSDEIQTVGQLRTALRNYKIKKTGKGLLTKIVQKGVEMIPVAGPDLAKFLDAAELGAKLYGGDLDKKAPLPGLDAMRVNPDVSKIVDDDIEKEFLKVLSQELEEADPNTPISVSYHLAQGLEKDYVFLDCFRATLYNPSGITYKWGFASDAYSDDSGLSPQGVRWGFFGKWA